MNSPSSPIKLVFWNCGSLTQRLKDGSIHALLNPIFTPNPPTILALVETRWEDHSPSAHKPHPRTTRLPTVPGYIWAHRHHTSRSGGIAVLYHNSIACLSMPTLNAQGAALVSDPASAAAVLWLTMRYPHRPAFLLGVGYLPPAYRTPAVNVEGVRGMCASLSQACTHRLPVLLVGDFNLHHRDWEDEVRANSTVAPANEFADFMREQDWTILNPLLMPHGITRPNLSSVVSHDAVIDLAITDSEDDTISHRLIQMSRLSTGQACRSSPGVVHRSKQRAQQVQQHYRAQRQCVHRTPSSSSPPYECAAERENVAASAATVQRATWLPQECLATP